MITDPCKTIDQPEQPVLSIHTTAAVQDLPTLIGKSYGQIMEHMISLGEQPTGMPFVAYYNMDMQALDLEIGFPTARTLPAKGDVQPGTIPAGKVATCEYTGPYEEMSAAYNEMSAWMEARDLKPTGTVYEYYLNGPMDATPDGYKTRIVFPLKG